MKAIGSLIIALIPAGVLFNLTGDLSFTVIGTLAIMFVAVTSCIGGSKGVVTVVGIVIVVLLLILLFSYS